MTLGQAMQTIVSRNADPLKAMVVSITQIHAGSAYNVIPDDGAARRHDARFRRRRCASLPRARIRELAAGIARGLRRDDRGRHPRHLHAFSGTTTTQTAAVERGGASSSSGRDNVETGLAPQDGQRGLRRHAAGRAGRLCLARPARRGRPCTTRPIASTTRSCRSARRFWPVWSRSARRVERARPAPASP